MCGILCLIQSKKQDSSKGEFNSSTKKLDLVEAQRCLAYLNDRGPDKSSYELITHEDFEIFMGFTRLAIMDRSDSGQQPFHDDNGMIICNGEIYNYKELAAKHGIEMKTSCDCEILLPLCGKVGFNQMIANELNGEFATVFYDNEHIYAARDRFGVRPLYYGYNDSTGLFGFASELKALHSIMEHVEQVPTNQIMKIDPVSLSVDLKQYYCFEKSHNFNLNKLKSLYDCDFEQIHTEIRRLLTEAVAKRLHSDRPIGFLLSGGLDSSLIVAIATKILGPENMVCFTIGIEGSPDVEASKKVVEFLGIKQHHIIPFSVETGLRILPDVIRAIETYDVTTIRASTPQYIMAECIKDNTDIIVILSGEGSDEEHGSYLYLGDAPNPKEFHDETIRLLRELCYFDNQRTDRTMAHFGLEVRVPFLDYDYVKFITELDPRLLMHRPDYMEKMIVRDSFQGYLPDEILYRRKEAFSDAVSNNEVNWAQSIQRVSNDLITDEQFRENRFTINKPKTKDAYFFRVIFDHIYPGRCNVIPHYWLPRFQTEEVYDPSARVLKSY